MYKVEEDEEEGGAEEEEGGEEGGGAAPQAPPAPELPPLFYALQKGAGVVGLFCKEKKNASYRMLSDSIQLIILTSNMTRMHARTHDDE
jgi:hypothetical protein